MEPTKRKTVLVLFFLSIQALLLSGCWDRTEINDLSIITAIGLDATDDHKLELSVNIFVNNPSGGQRMGEMSSADGGEGGQSVVRSAAGVTMADATSKLQKLIPRKVFWGQAEVIVFGERLAKQGLAEPMEYLTRHPTPREHAYVFVSKGLAKDVLLLQPPIERTVADVLREMAKSQTGLNITMKELAQMMAGKANAAVIPWVEIKPKQERQESFPFITGTAIVKNGKLVGRMNDHTTRGIMWLRNEIKSATVTVSPKDDKGYVSLYMLRSNTKLVPHIEGDNWSITVKIETQDDIVENTTNLNLMEPEHIQELENELRTDIENRVKAALTEAQKKMNADIFNFADAFYRKYPKEWKQVKDRWHEIYPKVEVKLETNPKVIRPGMTGKSLFKPEQR
ncbi:Ger(x)C family spore germination protein [Effusibacillus lacus]|uniref:Spore gernimation protein GerC n=1 Tax=Effusibacillus lacus TaxID=1348429 RepID=A0A292YTF4_9BACL|nr:Ger(x)C family spore germination protein [Effusibacillus lacus]TCS75847.1 spore germination protein KC [Effusibacillus lacus]GAX91760.1 spore gernimation protein GerC [Effusibacillus lacus]